MKNTIIILKLLILLTSLSLVSCIEKQEQLSNKTLGRFTADTISISYPSINHVLTIGSPITIAPDIKIGKITACGIKYGTGSLPPGLFVDSDCKISGTPLVLAFTFNYKITAISEYNTTTEANITITVGTYYNLGGVVSGLSAGQTVTVGNGVDTTIVTANGNFSLTPVANGEAYTITKTESNPARFTCTVVNGAGVISQNTNNVQINCAPSGTRTLGGTLSGLVPADGSVQLSNAGVNVSVTSNGSFTFGALSYGSNFNITVNSKPLGYECTVSSNGAGVLNDDLNSVTVVCIPPTPKKIYAKVTGLNIGTFTIQNNGSEVVTVNSDGMFEFVNKVAFNTPYAVTILTQPAQHTCTIANASGTALADVTNIAITCNATLYNVSGLVSGVTAGDHVKFVFNDATTATEFDYDYSNMGAGFSLPRSFEHGKQYRMYLSEAPAGKKCKFTTTNPTPSFKIIGDTVQGFINASHVTDLNINCSARDTANCEFGHLNYMSPLGDVNDMACDGNHLYVAGAFLDQGHQNGLMSEVPSSLITDYKQSFKVDGGGVRSAVSDGNGGMYIAGDFTKVNGEARLKIARLYPDGSLDQRFNPNVTGYVNKIVLKGNYLYLGGVFTKVGTENRQNFAKINRFTGNLESLNISFNAAILDMVMRNSNLAIGGSFTTVSSPTPVVKACLAEINTELDQLSELAISFTSACSIYSLDRDSSNNLYAGGSFQNAGNIPSLNYLFRIKEDNDLDTTFASGAMVASALVYKVKVVEENGEEKLIVGGNFSSIFGTSSTYLAKYNIDTSTKESLVNTLTNVVSKIASDNLYIYVTDTSGKMARYDKGMTSANLVNNSRSVGVVSNSLLENINGKIYGSDLNDSYGRALSGANVKYLFRYNLNNGRVDNNFNLVPSAIVNSILIDGTTMYAAGGFSTFDSITRRYIAKFSLTNLVLDTGFAPVFTGSVSVGTVNKIILKNSELITFGTFTTSNGKFLVSFDKATGAYRSTVDSTLTVVPYNLAVFNSDLYVMPSSREQIKKFSIGNPFIEDSNFSLVGKNLLYFTVGASGLYVGGGTAVEINGTLTSKYLARVSTLSGAIDSSFQSNTTYVYANPYLNKAEDYLYTTGNDIFNKLTATVGTKVTTYDTSNISGSRGSAKVSKVIEGDTFLILGGNFNATFATEFPPNFSIIPK